VNALDKARKLKKAEADKKAQEAKDAEESSRNRDIAKDRMVHAILIALNPFRKLGFKIKKGWFAGSDYWSLIKREKTYVTCVLEFKTGTWDASDDCRGIPYSGWEIWVLPGSWSGPTERKGMAGLSIDTFEEYVAQYMKDHVWINNQKEIEK